MSEVTNIGVAKRRKRKWSVLALLVVSLIPLLLWLTWLTVGDADPIFRDQRESVWVKNLKYWDDQQVKEWRGYGEEGVQVLIRGLEHANRPGEKAYRKVYRRTPGFLARWLPAPKQDSTYSTRMCLVSLVSSLGNDAKSAKGIMVRTLNTEETAGVRMMVISYFNSSENEKCLLNQLPANEKQALLPGFIRAIQDKGDWGLRNNAANALKWYPEQRKIVAPVLVKALQDPQPNVRLLAAEALNRVDPDTARKAGALSVVAVIAKNPDDQIASRAIAALGEFKDESELVVPVLIEGLQSTNSLVACQSVWSLEWATSAYSNHSNMIVPALQKAAERSDNAGKYAKTALAKWESKAFTNQGAK